LWCDHGPDCLENSLEQCLRPRHPSSESNCPPSLDRSPELSPLLWSKLSQRSHHQYLLYKPLIAFTPDCSLKSIDNRLYPCHHQFHESCRRSIILSPDPSHPIWRKTKLFVLHSTTLQFLLHLRQQHHFGNQSDVHGGSSSHELGLRARIRECLVRGQRKQGRQKWGIILRRGGRIRDMGVVGMGSKIRFPPFLWVLILSFPYSIYLGASWTLFVQIKLL
jgi:hypothetical protein